MATVVTINSIDRSDYVRAGHITIEERLGSRATLRAELFYTDMQRPVPMHTITVAIDGTTYFSGPILGIEESTATDRTPSSGFKGLRGIVMASDNNHYADRALTIIDWTGTGPGTYSWAPGGMGGSNWTLKGICEDIVSHWLNSAVGGIDFDITLHPSQAVGPSFTHKITVEWVTVTDLLNQLTVLTGWTWSIDASKQLRFVESTATSAPAFPGSVILGTSNTLTDTVVKQEFADYCNSVFVLYKGPAWGCQENLTQTGYYNRWMRFINAPEVENATDANAMASAVLAKYAWLPKVVTCRTRLLGFHPGQRGTVYLPALGIKSGGGEDGEEFSVQAVQYNHHAVRAGAGGTDAGSWITTLELMGGSQIPATFAGGFNWVDQWQGMVSGPNQSSTSIVATNISYSISGFVDFQAPLGGSRDRAVQHTTWADVPGWIDVTLNSTKYPGMTIYARVWVKAEAGVTVRPRIQNITDGTTAGTGDAVSGETNWIVPQEFAITLGTGQKDYRLQVLPSDSTAGVYAVGVLFV